MNAPLQMDLHTQLRTLYRSLLTSQERFDEFKQLLASYPCDELAEVEPASAREIRDALNDRIRQWTQSPSGGLSATQVQMWKAILVDQRFNIALSPWKESNTY